MASTSNDFQPRKSYRETHVSAGSVTGGAPDESHEPPCESGYIAVRESTAFQGIVGSSPALLRVLDHVRTVAPTDSTVLIEGETGTGKELIAKVIHNLSSRRQQRFVRLNCAAIPAGLLESELFGHERGAFTGALVRKLGRFELADKGTLVLDEIGDMPSELQPKLLRVLQEKEFERVGSTQTQRVNVRVIAATNCDLKQMVQDKRFRSDLYFRLNVFPITIPPLRTRREDIASLVLAFVNDASRRLDRRVEYVPPATMETLVRYHWPGNIRELQNFIERAVILSSGPVLEAPVHALVDSSLPPDEELTLEETSMKHILQALKQANWVVGGKHGAAERLGLKRTTLIAKMQKLGITRPNEHSPSDDRKWHAGNHSL
jgi:transcriptional regulator with GAF, ATPase, and Fis domain